MKVQLSMKMLMCLLLLSSPAFSQVTLTYQSAMFPGEDNTNNIPCPNPQESQECLQISITVPSLPPNLNNQSVGAAQVNSVVFGPNQPVVPIYGDISSCASFYFSTDSTGKIIGWNFTITSITAAHGAVAFIGSSDIDYMVTTQYGVVGTPGPGTWTQPPPPPAPSPVATVAAGTKVLECTPTYKVIAPANNAVINVSETPSGSTKCMLASTVPAFYYVKTTTNYGGSWEWTYTLADLGLGTH
jgi:hypothetical protein